MSAERNDVDLAHMRVVRGAPDDVEVAALVAGLASVAAHGLPVTEDALARSPWPRSLRPAARDRSTAMMGGDAWRWSLRD